MMKVHFVSSVVIKYRSTGKSDIPMDNGPPTVKSFLPFQPYKGHIAGAAAAMVQQKLEPAPPAPVPAPQPVPAPAPTSITATLTEMFGGNPLKRSSILEPPEVVAARRAAMENPSKTKSMAELAREIQEKVMSGLVFAVQREVCFERIPGPCFNYSPRHSLMLCCSIIWLCKHQPSIVIK
jgi:hypothetical protein